MPTQLDRNAAARRIDELLADSSDDPVQPNCRGEDPELFFPRSQVPAVARDAIEVCTDCPMKDPCLAYAMVWDVEGVWGATTKPERDRSRAELGTRPLTLRLPIAPTSARTSHLKPVLRASRRAPHDPAPDRSDHRGGADGAEPHRGHHVGLLLLLRRRRLVDRRDPGPLAARADGHPADSGPFRPRTPERASAFAGSSPWGGRPSCGCGGRT